MCRLPLLLMVMLLAGCAAGEMRPHDLAAARVASFDETPLVYDARGSGEPALVFVHGWCCNRTQWEHQLEHFSATHRVIAIDLAGHGDSGDVRSDWKLANFARDVEAVVVAQRLDEVILVGHSMGGPVCAMAAARIPDRVIGVIGVDTLHNAEMIFPADQAAQLAAVLESDLPGTMTRFIDSMYPASLGIDATVVERVTRDAIDNPPHMASAVMRQFATVDFKQLLADCPVPVRCINAASPTPTAIEVNRRYNPDFGATLMIGAGHWPHLENPAEFNRHLREQIDVIERRSSGSASDAAPDAAARAAVLQALTRYYEDLSARDWEALATHFWPGATITTVWQPPGEPAERIMVPLPEFLALAPEGPGSKPIFEERMLWSEVKIHHNLSQAWAGYEARFGEPGNIAEWQGIDAFTLMRHDGVWRIVSIAFTPTTEPQ